MEQLIFVDGMKPGHGVNLLTGDHKANVAVNGQLTPISFALGQKVETNFERIEDISTLHKSLGIEVTADGSYMGFSANAKVEFADKCNFNSHSVFILMHVKVTNAFVSMDDPTFTDDAIELLKNKNPDRFRERFGDIFIDGVSTGGEYFAVYQVSSTSEDEQEQIAVAVEASFRGGLTSADLGVKINNATNSSKSHLAVTAQNFQNGGSDPRSDLTPEQIMEKARNFAGSVSGEFSIPYSALPASYDDLKKPDDAANLIDIEAQREALADAWKVRNDLVLLKNDIDYVLFSEAHNHEEFEPFDVKRLTDARNQLANEIDTISKGASQCMRDAKQCSFAKFDVSNIQLPRKKTAASTPAKSHDKMVFHNNTLP